MRRPAAGSVPLVSRSISPEGEPLDLFRNPRPDRFELLPVDVRVVRDYGPQPQPEHLKQVKRGAVQMFSAKSASRLTRAARNAKPGLVSQFCLTYHESGPDGEAAKSHLRAWLQALRDIAPGARYLWILEFQTRGVPHFHVWLTVPYSVDLWKRLGAAWNRIADPGDPEHLWWHTEVRVNPFTGKLERSFMPWEMKGAGYLRKYMSKEAQKCVPDGFGFVGRFWGASRGLVPAVEVIEAHQLPDVVDLTRTVSKWVEARRRRGAAVARKIAADRGKKYHALKLRPTVRAHSQSGWLNNGAAPFWKYLEYLEDQEALKRGADG